MLLGWQALFAACNYVESRMIQALLVLTQPEYNPKPFHQMLIFWAATAFAVFMNILASTVLPIFEGCVLLYWVTGFFAVLIPLLALGQHQKPTQVFNNWINEGDFSSQGLSFMVGLVGTTQTIMGADGAVHVSPISQTLSNTPNNIEEHRCLKKYTTLQPWFLSQYYSASLLTVLWDLRC